MGRRIPSGAILALVVASLLFALPAAAQEGDVSRLEVGDTIRFRMPGALRVGGAFHGWNADYMLVGVRGIEDDWPVSLFDLASLDIFTDRTTREGFRHFALLGAASGLFLGAGVGLALHSLGVIDDPDAPETEIIRNVLRWAGLGTLAGTVGGAVYGGRSPGRGWVEIPLPGGGAPTRQP